MIVFRATLTALDIILAAAIGIYTLRKASDDISGAMWFVFCLIAANGVGLWL